MDLSTARQEVARGLRHLEAAIERLVDTLAHGPVAAEIEASTHAGPVRTSCEAYSAINYGMEDKVGSSIVCLGVLGVSPDAFAQAAAVNAAKADFKRICAPLYGIRVRIPVKGNDGPTQAIPIIRVILRSIQRSDLNLLAAYRKIPLLQAAPATVTYTRANTRSVYRKSIAEIEDLLARSDGPTAAADRARLSALGHPETHLALVKERYPNIRANVRFVHLDPRGRGRAQIAAELPILYARGRRTELPKVTFPAPAADTANPARVREAKLEAHPFLQSIPVYRYARPPGSQDR